MKMLLIALLNTEGQRHVKTDVITIRWNLKVVEVSISAGCSSRHHFIDSCLFSRIGSPCSGWKLASAVCLNSGRDSLVLWMMFASILFKFKDAAFILFMSYLPWCIKTHLMLFLTCRSQVFSVTFSVSEWHFLSDLVTVQDEDEPTRLSFFLFSIIRQSFRSGCGNWPIDWWPVWLKAAACRQTGRWQVVNMMHTYINLWVQQQKPTHKERDAVTRRRQWRK